MTPPGKAPELRHQRSSFPRARSDLFPRRLARARSPAVAGRAHDAGEGLDRGTLPAPRRRRRAEGDVGRTARARQRQPGAARAPGWRSDPLPMVSERIPLGPRAGVARYKSSSSFRTRRSILTNRAHCVEGPTRGISSSQFITLAGKVRDSCRRRPIVTTTSAAAQDLAGTRSETHRLWSMTTSASLRPATG